MSRRDIDRYRAAVYQARPANEIDFTWRDLFHLAWTFLAVLVLFAAAMTPLVLGLFGTIEGGH